MVGHRRDVVERDAVADELTFDPDVDPSGITVRIVDGKVTLPEPCRAIRSTWRRRRARGG
jgi:hypothetical protein